MLSVVVLDTMSREEKNISEIVKTAYARRELPIGKLAVAKNLPELLKNGVGVCDAFIASVSGVLPEYIDFAQKLRRDSAGMFIVFVLNRSTDITAYVRPSIRPSGILFIPLEEKRVYQTVRDIYAETRRAVQSEDCPGFKVKIGADYILLNTGDIYFFEAQSKKVAIKTRGQELLFYSNFDEILNRLPPWFKRCHKGFVVNVRQVARANFSDMTLTLRDGCVIPVSRTYRDSVRSALDFKG